jgi:hypothetical protein
MALVNLQKAHRGMTSLPIEQRERDRKRQYSLGSIKISLNVTE